MCNNDMIHVYTLWVYKMLLIIMLFYTQMYIFDVGNACRPNHLKLL